MAFVERYPDDARVVRWCFAVAIAALGVGGLFGLVQALHRTGVFRGVVSSTDYYTILTAHGVLLALVFTTFFIAGLFTWATSRSFERSVYRGRFSLLWFGTMLLGTLLAVVAIMGGVIDAIPMSADVLFTFYAPMKAHPAFYVGAALLIIGSWLAGANYFLTYREWRADNPDERIPLQAFMVLTTMLMWYVATIGVAVEVVFFLIPWSLGLIAEVDPLLTRTLFWYFGHPVVYFWLLPAYLLWYTLLPKLAGGRLFSDGLARVVFVLFLILSTPTGFHHQYVDPGIPEGFKFVAMTNTMFLLLPSLLTAFTVVASIEHGARQSGGTGRLGWLRSLPWDDPAFSGMAFAGIMFAAAGFSGMVNAGMNLNYLIHNTLWVPGHFHLTVGTAFALTAMAATFWLLPQVTGCRLRWRPLAVLQPYVWFTGMALMSNAMHRAGLLGVPRRTAEPQYPNTEGVEFAGAVGGIGEIRLQIAAGGVILFVALAMFLAVVARTWVGRAGGQLAVNGEIPDALTDPADSPRVLDNLRLWTGVALLLVILAYVVPIASMLADGVAVPGSAPIPMWL
ncbi:MAG: b(o/a)3-type cytochrome-c oxidase subunit 1 [Halobacteriaceae archaeon]